MTDLPDMKIKAVPVFPATTTGGDGIDVVREGGEYTIDLDYADFAPPASGLVDPGNETLLIWNVVTGTYTLAPVSLFGAGGGVPEAPTDGVVYGRKDANWEVIPDAGLGSAYPSNEVPTMDSVAAPGVSALYSRGDHVHPSDASKASTADVTIEIAAAIAAKAVRYDAAQTLTEAQDAQARSNIYAASFDALAYNGMQINGSMEVSQEVGTTTTNIPANTVDYVIDQWSIVTPGTAFNAQQQVSTLQGFSRMLAIYNLAATTFTGAQEMEVFQPIEGQRWSRLGWGAANGSSVTIGFWINASVTGTLTVAVRNFNATRSYCVPVAYTSAAAWQYVTVTIPPCPDGAWNQFTDVGGYVGINLGAGPTVTNTPNTWLAGNYTAATGQSNFYANASQAVFVTGVVVLPGIEAPSAERSALIMRPYGDELVTCQRYWQKTSVFNRWSAATIENHDVTGKFNVTFRASPTLTILTAGSRLNTAAVAVDTPSIEGGFRHSITSVGAGDAYALGDIVTGDARL